MTRTVRLKGHRPPPSSRRLWTTTALSFPLSLPFPSSSMEGAALLFLLSLLFFFLFVNLLSTTSVFTKPSSSFLSVVQGETLAQRQAVVEFYHGSTSNRSGGGGEWNSSCSDGGWRTMTEASSIQTFCNSATSPAYSTYYGITCSAPNGSITQLNLNNCSLSGTLTASLSALTDMVALRLHVNQLSGTLPPEWSAMRALQVLSLHANQLTGTLPSEWSHISGLKALSLYTNKLTGTLPPQWSAMTEFQYLHLSSNGLSGTLPRQWSAMRALQALSLSANQLTGTLPSEWPEGMRSIQNTVSHFCNANCSGVVGVDATCSGSGPTQCIPLALWYNCLDVVTLPAINHSNLWNWANQTNMGFGPQRTDCEQRTLSHHQTPSSLSASLSSFSLSLPNHNMRRSTHSDSLTVRSSSVSVSPLSSSASLSQSATPSPSHTAAGPHDSSSPTASFSTTTARTAITPSASELAPVVVEQQVEAVISPLPRAVEGTAATVGTVGGVGLLLGVDPAGAALQATLTFMACRKHDSTSTGPQVTMQSWLATLPISPFFPLGFVWAAVGNAVLWVCVVALHGGCVVLVYAARRRRRGSSASASTDNEHPPVASLDAPSAPPAISQVASSLRFPSLSLSAGEWLLTGVAVCGAALASSEQEGSDVAVGWTCVTASAAFLALWFVLARRAVRRCRVRPSAAVHNRRAPLSVLHALLHARCEWEPAEEVRRSGTLFDAMAGQIPPTAAVAAAGGPTQTASGVTAAPNTTWWWRWASVATTGVVAVVTGAGGVRRGGGCATSLWVCAALLLTEALLLAVARPYKLPTENALNPLKFALLGATSLALVTLDDGTPHDTALAVLSTLQTFVMVLRVSVKVYLKACDSSWLLRQRNLCAANGEQCPSIDELCTTAPPAAAATAAALHPHHHSCDRSNAFVLDDDDDEAVDLIGIGEVLAIDHDDDDDTNALVVRKKEGERDDEDEEVPRPYAVRAEGDSSFCTRRSPYTLQCTKDLRRDGGVLSFCALSDAELMDSSVVVSTTVATYTEEGCRRGSII